MRAAKWLICWSIIGIIISCGKTPDDPDFSLRSRRARVIGNWKIVSAIYQVNGGAVSVPPNANEGHIEFRRHGKYTWQYTYGGTKYLENGKWDFNYKGEYKSRTRLILSYTKTAFGTQYSGSGADEFFEILELWNKRMVLYKVYGDSNTTYEHTYWLEKD